MRLLGLDVGSERIGVAVSDEQQQLATALVTIPREGGERDVEAVGQAMRDAGAGELVIGLPLTLEGKEGAAARRVRRLGELLAGRLGCAVHYQDERFTTCEAERLLTGADLRRDRRKKVVDRVAAVLILQGFLDRRSGEGEGRP